MLVSKTFCNSPKMSSYHLSFRQASTPTSSSIRLGLDASRSTTRVHTCELLRPPSLKSRLQSSPKKFKWILIWRTLCARCAECNMDHTTVVNWLALGECTVFYWSEETDCNFRHFRRYFCRQCWQLRHNNDIHLRNHKPLTRNSKSQQIIGIGPQSSSSVSSPSSSNGCNSDPTTPTSPTAQVSGLNQLLNFALK